MKGFVLFCGASEQNTKIKEVIFAKNDCSKILIYVNAFGALNNTKHALTLRNCFSIVFCLVFFNTLLIKHKRRSEINKTSASTLRKQWGGLLLLQKNDFFIQEAFKLVQKQM